MGRLKDNKGFTLVELFIVLAILGVLAQMALTFMVDLRTRSYDVTAVADGRNLITVVRNNFVNSDDVNYTKINDSEVGVETTGDVARPPVYTLSPGVVAVVTGGSRSSGIPNTNFFEAKLYHVNGSKEFYYLADETLDPPLYSFLTY